MKPVDSSDEGQAGRDLDDPLDAILGAARTPEQAIALAEFPVVRLQEPGGLREELGSIGYDEKVTGVELVYQAEGDGTRTEVYLGTSLAGSEHPPELGEHDVADRAADLLIPSASSRAEVHEIYEAAFRTPGTALIPVDGKSIEFLLVERGSEFAAVARTGELFVSLLVENGDPRDIKLATSANR